MQGKIKPILKHYLLIALMLGISLYSYTQVSVKEDCAVTLKKCQKLYEEGLIELIPDLLIPCFNSNSFTNKNKISALRLIVKTYLFDDKKDKAEEYMIKLLKIDPETQINEAVDPQELIQLFESFRTDPIYSLNINIGSNLTFLKVLEDYGIHDIDQKEANYKPVLSFNIGGGINRNLFDNAAISIDINFSQLSINYKESQWDFSELEYNENLNFFTLPISFYYALKKRNSPIYPHFKIGINTGYLATSKAVLTRFYNDKSLPTVEGPEVKRIDRSNNIFHRKQWNIWGIIGSGINYKVRKGNVFFDLRYNVGLQNIVNKKERYSSSELIYKYFYVDDNFKLNHLSFTFGFYYNIYKPKKK